MQRGAGTSRALAGSEARGYKTLCPAFDTNLQQYTNAHTVHDASQTKSTFFSFPCLASTAYCACMMPASLPLHKFVDSCGQICVQQKTGQWVALVHVVPCHRG